MKPTENEQVRLAIPNKGRISQPIIDLLEKGGLHLQSSGGRKLITKTVDPMVEVLFARPIDIPEYVASGAADLGITGRDMVLERGSQVEELLDLKMGEARLVLAVPEESGITTAEEMADMTIATEFPGITARYFGDRGITPRLFPVGGACEATPYLGVADAIVDLTSSGTTLKTNHLRIIDELLSSTTIVIANSISRTSKALKIDEICLALESVLAAQGQCYLMMNVERRALDEVRNVLPGLAGPTVMDVASNEHLVAVHAVVAEERIYELISQLRKAGARDILVMPIERMIR
ncbi:ATP phosphoribosyltransferase [Methanomicrobiaceae archaeon CYW5]|uniref:ATP phosphoribosyltransferase n=1 Tax=Methanovulcanius yangii TaxID=1789227 RepID=UPI0029C9F5D4|nr:ATP phosphoribosyltransferase [Methanovulcanius yangii]MBT8507983.1 ATP phosphoribosyltransferase [Methanovulcanius yangii]